MDNITTAKIVKKHIAPLFFLFLQLNPKDMKKSLVIGGSNGIGLSIAIELQKVCQVVTVVDKVSNPLLDRFENIRFHQANLLEADYSFLEDAPDIDTLVSADDVGSLDQSQSISD